MTFFDRLRPLVLTGLALTLAACGSLFGKEEPSRGDMMIAQGEAVADLGEMWNEGRKMVDRADTLAADGARLKGRGQDNVEKGQTLIESGQTVAEEQQREYARFVQTLGPLVTLQTAIRQRERLDRLVDDWHRGWMRQQEGHDLVEKGRSQIAGGKAKLAEAADLRSQGHTLMQKAERAYNSRGPIPASQVGE